MTIDADGEKELPGEEKGVANAALDAGQISLKHNELTVDADLNDVDGQELQAQGVLQLQQQQSQGAAAVCWERFLHVRSIKVMLVENDDSTRHVVTALLRNCNYEGRYLHVITLK
jgi:pseudo-response regulator 7